jgi:hypothetical protein
LDPFHLEMTVHPQVQFLGVVSGRRHREHRHLSRILSPVADAELASTWKLRGSVLTGSTSGSVADPTSVLGTGEIIATSVDGSLIVSIGADGSTAGPTQSAGVPSGQAIENLSFADESTGWATTEGGSCSGDKTTCTQRTSVLATSDGGKTWTELSLKA